MLVFYLFLIVADKLNRRTSHAQYDGKFVTKNRTEIFYYFNYYEMLIELLIIYL